MRARVLFLLLALLGAGGCILEENPGGERVPAEQLPLFDFPEISPPKPVPTEKPAGAVPATANVTEEGTGTASARGDALPARGEDDMAAEPQRVHQYPYPGKNAYSGRSFRVEVGQGFVNSQGEAVIELLLVNDAEEIVSREFFREGDTDSRWVDGEGNHFIQSGVFKVEEIYRKLGEKGKEEYRVKIIG